MLLLLMHWHFDLTAIFQPCFKLINVVFYVTRYPYKDTSFHKVPFPGIFPSFVLQIIMPKKQKQGEAEFLVYCSSQRRNLGL